MTTSITPLIFMAIKKDKWAGRLTANGWTVIIVDQIKDSRGKVKERKVVRSSTTVPQFLKCVIHFTVILSVRFLSININLLLTFSKVYGCHNLSVTRRRPHSTAARHRALPPHPPHPALLVV